MNQLISSTAYFRWTLPCKRVDSLGNVNPSGKVVDLSPDCELFDPRVVFAPSTVDRMKIHAAWSPNGLGFIVDASSPFASSSFQHFERHFTLWVDTRDTRSIHRASKFCHCFQFSANSSKKTSRFQWIPINRAQAEPPQPDPVYLKYRMSETTSRTILEVYLPAQVLHGFDPDVNRRLGFTASFQYVQKEDFLGLGNEFPYHEDPSLWAVLELRG